MYTMIIEASVSHTAIIATIEKNHSEMLSKIFSKVRKSYLSISGILTIR
jgi:hypothetical protein